MKTTKFLALLIVLTSIFTACKKTQVKDSFERNDLAKINDWLNKKIGDGVGKAKDIAKGIKENLQSEIVWESTLKSGFRLVVIPIKSNYKFVNNREKNPKNYLLTTFGKDGLIKDAILGQSLNGIYANENTFASIFDQKNDELNGEYNFLTIRDNFIRELKFRQGKLIEMSQRKTKISDNSINNNGTTVCTDYYVLRTTYGEGGVILNQEVLYTFQVCNCVPTNMVQTTIIAESDCDINSGGGGGGGIDMQAALEELMSGALFNITKNNTTHVVNTSSTTHLVDFLSGEAPYWDVTNTAQFQVVKNSNNTINVVYNSTMTHLNTYFPGPLSTLFSGSYTPNATQLTPNVDHNNTTSAFCKVIRVGTVRIEPTIPGTAWVGSSSTATGTLNNTFVPL